ncbi:MAG: hypothetical protein COA86_14380 [Kangiella sp.]|nr:MAG: hypothetical protein COA86_14380 [Kangiella sp.]
MHRNSLNKCDRVVESTARANCYENVNESYSNIQERMDKRKKQDMLDFKRKIEPTLKEGNQ